MAFSFFKKKKKKENNDSRYINLTVKEVVKETNDAVTLVFEQPESGDLNYQPGQFITLILTINGKKVRRAYSLCSAPALGELPAVTVKAVVGGIMSNYINNEVKAGDVIQIMEPMGSFVLDINAGNKKQVFLFGGGSGVTPLLSIAKSLLKQEPDSKVSLVYANRDMDSIIFKNTIKNLQTEYQNRLDVIHFLETPPSDWTGHTGYMTREKITQIITELKEDSYSDFSFMTCGPEPLMNIVWEALEELKIPEDKKFKESFVAGNTSPSAIIADANGAHEVTVVLEGEEYIYEVPANKTILEAGLDRNIDLPYSCQSGLCTACRGKCLEGSIKMDEDDGLSDEEKAEGYVLLCVGHPESDDVKIEIG
ncbi:ferredoxin--NADP reductase [Reichenbachiella carrageenanivorans]|uniref:Ferredoxin--NADP reductase n=1 Tax=Reichenbachiella carrageenanivorans TaxID=2979869 RepID=A0ABY6D3Q8_9BACT|nr:ferredoxin--NADP reductase [Reichenbachiella carrageenanivorans]UXX80786.1 ferredoxin--NADP reductase [Reichenbachiella carrageenanivorans]